MLDLEKEEAKLLSVGEKVLAFAKAAGATSADVVSSRGTEFDVKVADGKIKNLSQATSKGLGVRVFVGQKLGFATTGDFLSDNLKQATERAVAMARETEDDEHHGIAEAAAGSFSCDEDLDLFDPKVLEISTDEKISWAHALEAAARSVSPLVSKFRESGVGSGEGLEVMMTSGGVVRTMRSTGISMWCNPIADKDGELQTEMWYDSKIHLEDLDDAEFIGKTAGERALRMLGAKSVETQKCSLLFEPHMASGFLGGILGGIDGDMVYKNASFLGDKLDTTIATEALSIVDDPHLKRGVSSTRYDGEGLKTHKKRLVDKGRLTTFLYDSYTARKAGKKSTHSARRGYGSLPSTGVFNVYAEAGDTPFEAIIKSTKKGLLMTRGMGSGVSVVTGEYSRGAMGLWIEDGEITGPVQEVTIAGNYLEMLKNIDAMGDKVVMRGARGAPGLRVSDVTLSGK